MARRAERRTYMQLHPETLAALGVFIKGASGTVLLANDLWRELGYSDEDMAEGRWLDLVHPDDRETALSLREVMRPGYENVAAVFRIRDSSGRWHWIRSRGRADMGPDGQERYVGLDVDLTEVMELREELAAERERAEMRALDAEALGRAGAIIAGSLGDDAALSQVLEQLRRFVDADTTLIFRVHGRSLSMIDHPHVDAVAPGALFETGRGRDLLREVIRNREFRVHRESHAAEDVWLICPLIAHGDAIGAAVIGRAEGAEFADHDIERARTMASYLAIALRLASMVEQLKELAAVDSLTGLLTRREFELRATRTIGSGNEICCLMVDIDHFKSVNDEFGHSVGDDALRMVAESVTATVRSADIVGRFGGEEFCALLPDTGVAEATAVAERIRARVREQRLVCAGDRAVTVSIGVASLDGCGAEASAATVLRGLVERSDAALYRAKRAGRDRVVTAE